MKSSRFCVWCVGCHFGSYCNMLDSCRFLFSWNLWIMLVISWALWALIVMHHILLLSWKCWDDYIYCCCRFIFSSFSLCQILGFDKFYCDGCVDCLANVMMCCFFERIWTTLGVASFLCWIIITLGRDLTRSCSMPLILDELVCAIFFSSQLWIVTTTLIDPRTS
jgi:hypothetical protein